MAFKRGDPVIFEDGPAVIFEVGEGEGYIVHKLAKDGTTVGEGPGMFDHHASESDLTAAKWSQMPKSRRPVDTDEAARLSAETLAAAPPPVPADTE